MDDDVERLGAVATEADQVGDNDLVTGAGDRQELGQPLDDTQDQRLNGGPEFHAKTPRHAPVARPCS
ncbi:hypothetical protein D3C81_1300460 [compost metagenome]